MTKQESFQKADYYRDLIHRNRPLTMEQQKEVDDNFRISFTYSNNAMEGNSLTIEETRILLGEGHAVGGRPVEAYDEAMGHAQAFDYMLSVARTKELEITETVIKRLHYLLCHRINQEEAGQYRKLQVALSDTGHLPPAPEEVPHLMEHFMNQIQSSKSLMHPIEFAAICHKRLIDIHPFTEGNGRVARLFMNLVLENAGYGMAAIPPELRDEYINALTLSQRDIIPDIDPFILLITNCVIESEREYCRLLRFE